MKKLLRRLATTSVLIASWMLVSSLAPAYADILNVDMSNLTFQAAAGNKSCSGARCTETFNITFQWDNTVQNLVPGTANVSGTGALSASDIAGPWTIGNFGRYPGGIGIVIDEFPGPDYIAIFDPDFITPLVPGTYAGSHATMACFEAPSQCDSLFDFTSGGGVVFPGAAISGTVTISSVPEPGSLPALLLTVASLAVLHRHRRIRA